jgi:hypothetical protein
MTDTAEETPAATRPVPIHVTLIHGGITNVRTSVAIGAGYESLPFGGPTAAFDRKLDGWLTRAVDVGIIGSTLGQLFTINFAQYHKTKEVKAKNLIMAAWESPAASPRTASGW